MSFDLSELLKDVSNSDTTREQIEYIRRDLIDSDPNNFYTLSGVEQLADNIATCGLQQPIRVRPNPNDAQRYMIVSGHRRNAAIEILAKEDPDHWQEIPCIVEQDAASPALQQLRLIYANANTRAMTSAELGEQAAQVEKLLYQLKEDGYEFPGRMRDHVAQAVNASRTKLARLKVIREQLIGDWAKLYKQNKINESTAYALAKMPAEWQTIVGEERVKDYLYSSSVESCMNYFNSISKIKCKHGAKACDNAEPKMHRCSKSSYYGYDDCHSKCCFDCDNLRTCKYSCRLADDLKREKRDVDRQAKRNAAEEQQRREKPVISYIQGVYARVGTARKAAGVSVKKLFAAQKVFWVEKDNEKQQALETGIAKIDVNTTLPFGYSFRAGDAEKLCAVADLLNCSIDYLLGREKSALAQDAPTSEDENNSRWQHGDPPAVGKYAVLAKISKHGNPIVTSMTWDGAQWVSGKLSASEVHAEILFWVRLPEEAQ